jgi:hypothetical protein
MQTLPNVNYPIFKEEDSCTHCPEFWLSFMRNLIARSDRLHAARMRSDQFLDAKLTETETENRL